MLILVIMLSLVVLNSQKNTSVQSQEGEPEQKIAREDPGSTAQPFVANESSQHVKLDFSQKYIDASNENEYVNVDIILNTESAKTNGAYIEIVYDPESLSNVDVFPAFDTQSLYGQQSDVTTLSHSPQEGKFVLGVSTSTEQEGTGRIATLSFKPLRPSSKSSTQVFFSTLSEGYSDSEKFPADSGSLEIKLK